MMRKTEVLILLLIGILPLLWYVPGQLIAKGDYYPYIFSLGNLYNDFYLWSPSNLGGTSPIPAYTFYGTLWALVGAIVPSTGFLQIILYIIQLAVSTLSMLFLVRTVYPRQDFAAITAAWFYASNFFMISILLNTGMLWTYAFLPLLLALFIRVLTRQQTVFKSAFYFAVTFSIVASVAGINLANIALVMISLASILLYYMLFERKSLGLFIKNIGILSVMTVLLSIWWIIPIFNHYLFSPSTQFQPEVNVVIWSWTHVRASFLNLFWLNGGWGWRPEYSPHFNTYSANPLLSSLMFVPFFLGSIALLFKGTKQRINLYLMLMILVFAFLAKGLHEPFGFVNLFLYNHIPYMNMFREPVSKFTLIMIPFLALLIGYSTDRIAKVPKHKVQAWLVVICIVLVFSVSAFPMFMNPIENKTELIPYSTYVNVPQYWYEANEWFNRNAGDYRILITPIDDYYQVSYSWGYYGSDQFIERLIQKPTINPTFIYAYKVNPNTAVLMNQLRDAIKYNRTQEFETIMRLLSVKYILQRNDLAYEDMASLGRDLPNPERMIKFFSGQSNIKLVQTIGELDIYEYTEAEPSLHILGVEESQRYSVEFYNETVFTVKWDFSTPDSLNQWRNATPLEQFGALCKLDRDGIALKFELWNSTWGWKILLSPSIPAQYGLKYNIRFDVKGENAHEVHVKIIEYDKNMTITYSEYASYVSDGTFNWTHKVINYVPKIENTTFLRFAIWNGHETDKPLPNIIWVDNAEVEGYITKLDTIGIQQALEMPGANSTTEIFGYERTNPTRIVVKVKSSGSFMLTIDEAYDPYWKAHINSETYDSVSVFSVMNGFRINKTGQFDIVIEYEPQHWFFYGSIISATTFLACVTYLTYSYTKNKPILKRIKTILKPNKSETT